MKDLWDKIRRSDWYETLAAYVLCGGALAALCFLCAGTAGLVSSLLALGAYALPSVLLVLAVWRLSRSHPHAGALLLQVGLLFRTMAAIGLMLVAVLLYEDLNWAAFLVSLFAAASAPVAGQVLLKR